MYNRAVACSRSSLGKGKDPDEHHDEDDYSTDDDLVVDLSFAAVHEIPG
jgi:hypothetical protein